MQVFDDISTLQLRLNAWRTKHQKIALVPTMGGLHAGHLSLITLAKKRADKVVVSVFVNPTQFAAHEDLGSYPRTLDADLQQLKACGVDGVFTPTAAQIYPEGKAFERSQFGEKIHLFEMLCGQTRPHFFFGVLQVVRRLFDIVEPDVAVFGRKDFQQLTIIKKFTTGVEIVPGDTVREDSGLAMSTRNQYLSADERKIASQLHAILTQLSSAQLTKTQAEVLLKQHFKLDYLSVLDANTLGEIDTTTTQVAILCAVFLGSTRLIDNIIYKQTGKACS